MLGASSTVGFAENGGKRGSLKKSLLGPALKVGVALEEVGQSQSGSGRDVYQGPSRQQTACIQEGRTERPEWGQCDFPGPHQPRAAFSAPLVCERKKPREFKPLSFEDSAICSRTQC